jgi:hypothetical protein
MFMATSCTVIIGGTELLEVLRESAAADGEVLSFSDKDPIQALDAITAHKPGVVVIERLFAATSRGAALINRIKADPSLASLEIRVASVDGTYRISPRRAQPAAAASPVPLPAEAAPAHVEAVPHAPAADSTAPPQNLDYRGTRRAPRFRVADGTEAQIDGALATVIDLSTHGAQIVSPVPLKPQQQVRMVLADDLGVVKFAASVAWAFFEIPKGVSRYRAGVEFKEADGKAVDAFRRRHALPPP